MHRFIGVANCNSLVAVSIDTAIVSLWIGHILMLASSTFVTIFRYLPLKLQFGSFLQGPTFGAMMISGQKAGHLALQALGLPNAIDGNMVGETGAMPELLLADADDTTASA